MFEFQQYLGFVLFAVIGLAGFWVFLFLLGFLPYWVFGYFKDQRKQKKAEADRQMQETNL